MGNTRDGADGSNYISSTDNPWDALKSTGWPCWAQYKAVSATPGNPNDPLRGMHGRSIALSEPGSCPQNPSQVLVPERASPQGVDLPMEYIDPPQQYVYFERPQGVQGWKTKENQENPWTNIPDPQDEEKATFNQVACESCDRQAVARCNKCDRKDMWNCIMYKGRWYKDSQPNKVQ